jgi:hypothetical protein
VLTFLQETVLPRLGAATKIYVVWDNFSAHKRALNLWVTRPPNVEVFWTPTNTSWLKLIEPWFLVLEKTALYNTNLKTTDAIAENLKQGINYLNDHGNQNRCRQSGYHCWCFMGAAIDRSRKYKPASPQSVSRAMLQWGRDRSIAEMQSPSQAWEGTAGFNGAAIDRSRKSLLDCP